MHVSIYVYHIYIIHIYIYIYQDIKPLAADNDDNGECFLVSHCILNTLFTGLQATKLAAIVRDAWTC